MSSRFAKLNLWRVANEGAPDFIGNSKLLIRKTGAISPISWLHLQWPPFKLFYSNSLRVTCFDWKIVRLRTLFCEESLRQISTSKKNEQAGQRGLTIFRFEQLPKSPMKLVPLSSVIKSWWQPPQRWPAYLATGRSSPVHSSANESPSLIVANTVKVGLQWKTLSQTAQPNGLNL